jgi:hypothetical protein
VGNVHLLAADARAAKFLDRLRKCGVVSVPQDDIGSGGQEMACEGSTEAPCPAGYDGRPSFKIVRYTSVR